MTAMTSDATASANPPKLSIGRQPPFVAANVATAANATAEDEDKSMAGKFSLNCRSRLLQEANDEIK